MLRLHVRQVAMPLVALAFGVGLAGPTKEDVAAHAVEVLPAEPFDPDVVKPPAASMLSAALEYQDAGDREMARAIAVAGIRGAGYEQSLQLRWVAAANARALNAPEEAAELLMPLALSHHPLSVWAKLRVAEWLEAKDPGRALALLDAALVPSSLREGWPAKAVAERARARVLAKLGRHDEAIETLDRLLTASSEDDRAAIQIIMPLAELLAVRGERDRVRALSLFRRVAQRFPSTSAGQRAQDAVGEILKTLPPSLRQSLRQPAPSDKLLHADALLASFKYRDAARAYAALESALAGDPEQRCLARFGRAKALISSRKRAAGSSLMADVAERCTSNEDLRAWARYYAGRAFSAIGKNEQAIAQYEALEKEAPRHRLADDALFRAAKVARDMGDVDGVVARLRALPERYPKGDMRPRARVVLALHAYQRGDLETAIATLSEDPSDDTGEDVQGRASYFRARFLALAGRRAEAVEALARTIERYPLTYYGQQAYARLLQLDPARARAAVSRPSQSVPPKLTFPSRAAFTHPSFVRAVALFSVQEHSLALWELRSSGFLSRGADPEMTWVTAAMLERSGAPHQALDLSRKRMADLLRRPPVGRNLLLYRLAYPNAFAPLIEKAAQREGVPAAFVRAVAREESGFYPRARSRAHAVGLVQLLPSTAKLVAEGGVKRPYDMASLMKPEINLAFGTRFMSTLAKSVQGQYGFVPPAYNAGPGALSRWLSERAHEPFDIWVENIPYDETRTYTRRVLQTYGVYHWLENNQMLVLPEHLPSQAN